MARKMTAAAETDGYGNRIEKVKDVSEEELVLDTPNADEIVGAVQEHLGEASEEPKADASDVTITDVQKDAQGTVVGVAALIPVPKRGRGKSLSEGEKRAMIKRVQNRVQLHRESVSKACKALGEGYQTYLNACKALGIDSMVAPRASRKPAEGKKPRATRGSAKGSTASAASDDKPVSSSKSPYTLAIDARVLVAANRQPFVEALLEGKSEEAKRVILLLLES